jgi:hypothetical protein
MKLEVGGFSEWLVSIYQISWRYTLNASNDNIHRRTNIASHIENKFVAVPLECCHYCNTLKEKSTIYGTKKEKY